MWALEVIVTQNREELTGDVEEYLFLCFQKYIPLDIHGKSTLNYKIN